MSTVKKLPVVLALIALASANGMAQEVPPAGDLGEINAEAAGKAFPRRGYSPYADRNYPTRVFWGDQHVHTGWSVDAGGFGATLGPEEALRFARGEQVTASMGQPAKLSRPLDWAAITDHSDGAGTIFEIRDGNPSLMADPLLKRWHDMMAAGQGVAAASEIIRAQSNKQLPPAMKDPKLAISIWEKNTAIVEKYNEPGRFTALIGYEWTSNAGGGDNLHRNVIYRDGKAKADMVVPMTTFDSENPEDLWKWMAAWEERTGGSLLAIPHNGNLSNGKMFALTTFMGDPLTRQWAETRARWEPMYEITQIKGDGETHPSLSPTDGHQAVDQHAMLTPEWTGSAPLRQVRPVGDATAQEPDMQTISVLSCATRGRIDREAARSTGPPRFRYRYSESDGSSAHGSCRPKGITAAWQLSDSGNGERHTAVSAAPSTL